MASIVTVASSPALNGQCARVFMSGANSITYLSILSIGQTCTLTSSSKTGTIISIDLYGTSFLVRPTTDSTRFDSSSTPGVLVIGETVTF